MTGRRQPIDRLFDLAIAVPTCTAVAVARSVPIAAKVGTYGTARVVGRLSDAIHEARHLDEETAAITPEPPQATDADAGADDAVADVDVADLPIEGYDDLAARQVVDRLGALEPDELAMVEVYERAHRNRSTVLGKIAMLQA